MAAGDVLVDADGIPLVTSDGNVVVCDEGAGPPNTDSCMTGCLQLAYLNYVYSSDNSLVVNGSMFSATEFSAIGDVGLFDCPSAATCADFSSFTFIDRSASSTTTWETGFVSTGTVSSFDQLSVSGCPVFDDFNQTSSNWTRIAGSPTPNGTSVHMAAYTLTAPLTGGYVTTGNLTVLNLIGNQTLNSAFTSSLTYTPSSPILDPTAFEYDPSDAIWKPPENGTNGRFKAILIASGTASQYYEPALSLSPTFPTVTFEQQPCGQWIVAVTLFSTYRIVGMRSPYGTVFLFSNQYTLQGAWFVQVYPT